MTKVNRILQEARQILHKEILELRNTLREKEAKLSEINRLLGGSDPLSPKKTISETVVQILKEADAPISAKEVSQQIQEMNIPQKASNPHNSILALLHHLKKQPDSKIHQTPGKKWFYQR